jgi:hypothetical protein
MPSRAPAPYGASPSDHGSARRGSIMGIAKPLRWTVSCHDLARFVTSRVT